MNVTEVLRRIAESACALVGATHAAVGTVGPDDTLLVHVQTFVDPSSEPVGEQVGAAVIRQVARGARPLRHGVGSQAVLGVPVGGTEPLGGLYLGGKQDGTEFTTRDEHVAATLAAAAAVAVDSVRRMELSRGRQQWLAASTAVTSALLAGESHSTTLQRIVTHAREAAEASAAAISRPVDGEGSLRFDVVDAISGSRPLTGLEIPVEGTATGLAFRSRAPVVVRRYGEKVVAQHAGSSVHLPAIVKDLDSAIAAPLIADGERLGALTVSRFGDATPFTDADVELVERFAGHAALVIRFSRAVADRQQLAVLEDRHRIARDMHDVVIQRLYAAGLRLYALGEQLPDPDLSRRAGALIEDLDRAIQDIRASIFALEEPRSARSNLRTQLRALTSEFSEVLGFEPRVRFHGPLDAAVPESVRPDLNATVREALSNVARHASATAIDVDVAVDPAGKELTLVVADDGAGFNDRGTRRSGLANLSARASRWSGSFSVGPRRGGGTELLWRVTLPRPGPESPADREGER